MANDRERSMKALVYTGTSSPLKFESIPVPRATVGDAVVRVLASKVNSYAREVYWHEGSNAINRQYPFPVPMVPGGSAIARVIEVGSDATKVQLGDLVYLDNVIRSRDNPTDVFIAGLMQGFTKGSEKLMTDVYRNWTYAEYCLAPLENLTVLDEKRLTGSPTDGGLGYTPEELLFAARLLVPYGGLTDIDLRPGETIIVAPATGPYGGAAVSVALAMGAKVIAVGRNRNSLETLRRKVTYPERLEVVKLKGDVAADLGALKALGLADAYLDIGPPDAATSTHIKSCILATRPGARISLMGGYQKDIAIPHMDIMYGSKKLFGKFMYEHADVVALFKLIEVGILKVGEAGGSTIVGRYGLEAWQEAWEAAANNTTFGQEVIITP